MLEANYDEEIIIDRMINDTYSASASQNHLSINQTIEILKNNYSSELQSITLIHLSDGNANAKRFKRRVQEELGFDNVVIADKGIVVELNKSEF